MKYRVQARNHEGKLVAMIVRTVEEIMPAVNKAGSLGYTEIESEPLLRDPADPETWEVVPPKPPCSEATPCHDCIVCQVRMVSAIGKDPTFRDHMAGFVDKPREPIPSADDFGPLPPAPKQERRYLGASSIPTIYEAFKSHVATLPDGSRVSLPAGTVLREGTLPPEIEPTEPRTLGEQLHEEHDRAAHADGSPCLCDPAEGAILADLTERVGLPREMAPSATPIIDAWRAAGEPAAMTFTAEDAARLTGIAAIFPEPARAPPHTVREEDDTGVRFVDRSQAMIDRNKRALETWNITAHESHLPDPPIGSGCLVYDCWTPCAPGHHHCARHGGADAVPPPSKPRT